MNVKCQRCGKLIEWVGGRQRKYCKNGPCRKQASREDIEARKRRERERQEEELRARCSRLHPCAREDVEFLIEKHGLEAAQRAMHAIEIQFSSLQRLQGNPQQKKA